MASRQAITAYIFLAPALIYFAVFYFYPIALEFGSAYALGSR